ncbi:MAG: hypothetical protein ACKVP4_12705 [Hyphomicrobium sp.]
MDNRSPDGATRAPRIGLVVVHGVGETEPGYCVNTLLEALVRFDPKYRLSAFSEYERLKAAPKDAEMKARTDVKAQTFEAQSEFVVARRRGEHENGTEFTAFELFWADVTALQPGRVNTMLGLFRVIFESHHLIDAMLDKGRSAIAWFLRKLLWIAGWLLRGPIAALTIATSAICALLLFQPDSFALAEDDARAKFLIVQAVLLASSVYLFWRVLKSREYSWYDAVFWMAVVTAALLALDLSGLLLDLLKLVPDLTTGTRGGVDVSVIAARTDCANPAEAGGCYVNGLYKVIIWGWRFWGLLVLIATAFLFLAVTRARKAGQKAKLSALATSIGIMIIQFLLWTTVVVSALYPMLNRAETNRTLGKVAPILKAADEWPALSRQADVAQLVSVPDIHADWIDRFKFIYASAAMTVVMFLLAAWGLMLIRRARSAGHTDHLEQIAERMPRLLFNSALMALLIASFLLVIGLVFLQPQLESDEGFIQFRSWFLPLAALFAVLTPMLIGHRITNVVHIARDLIDHHYSPRLETSAYFLPSVFKVRHEKPRRARIEGRLLCILENFVKDERYDQVIFVAHSQGSIVVYDYLLEYCPEYADLGGATPTLLTFGSPLGHIYQKYFHEYDPRNPVPDGFAGALSRWVNLYRVDDYIGGRIPAPEGLALTNLALGPGGHTGYWSLPAVASALDELIQTPPTRGGARSAASWPRSMPEMRQSQSV